MFSACYSFWGSAPSWRSRPKYAAAYWTTEAKAIAGAEIRTGTVSTLSGVDGNFKLNINYGTSSRPVLSIILENYQPLTTTLPANTARWLNWVISCYCPAATTRSIFTEQLPTINVTLEGLEEDASSNSIGINGLLGATRDPFLEAAAFKFSAARFRIRGLNTENSELYLNGLPFNDLESGRVFFGQFGGLNRVTNGRLVSVGVDANEYGFGGIGGLASIDLRARSRKNRPAPATLSPTPLPPPHHRHPLRHRLADGERALHHLRLAPLGR